MRGNNKGEDGQEISALCPSPYQCSQQHRFGSLCQLWSRLDTTCLFVTTCGFAYATSLLEVYKQVSGKSLQKTKGLRK